MDLKMNKKKYIYEEKHDTADFIFFFPLRLWKCLTSTFFTNETNEEIANL